MKTIVIIEDDENLLRFMRVNLNVEGYVALGARTPQQGLQSALEARADLVILDVAMPELAGWELLARFTSHPVLHNVPILILTDSANPDEEMRVHRMGAADYLVRPVSATQLVRHVRRLLSDRRASTGAMEDSAE